MEQAIELFSVFGGVEWDNIDISKPTVELIKTMILPDYTFIRNDITQLTEGLPLHHSILSGLATGDMRLQTAFKRANVSKEVGEHAITELCDSKIIRTYKSSAIFNSPFLRFWFAFVSPIFKGVRDGDYAEFTERYAKRRNEFVQQTFLQLSHELIKRNFAQEGERLKEIYPYTQDGITFDIYATTHSKQTILGVCRYANAKTNKSELTKLQESAQKAGIDADIFILISKNGFSHELKALKNKALRLITLKNFTKLLEQ